MNEEKILRIYYRLMNIIDFRYWFCDCHYELGWGLMIDMSCKYHGEQNDK